MVYLIGWLILIGVFAFAAFALRQGMKTKRADSPGQNTLASGVYPDDGANSN